MKNKWTGATVKPIFINFRFSIFKPIIVTFILLRMIWDRYIRIEFGKAEASNVGLNLD